MLRHAGIGFDVVEGVVHDGVGKHWSKTVVEQWIDASGVANAKAERIEANMHFERFARFLAVVGLPKVPMEKTEVVVWIHQAASDSLTEPSEPSPVILVTPKFKYASVGDIHMGKVGDGNGFFLPIDPACPRVI